ncbi:MAG TPA: hypothetical protein VFD42_07905, partial [Chloroflexota bacterium]|nr:hypothetical protein [Chloroflexota bacterium]
MKESWLSIRRSIRPPSSVAGGKEMRLREWRVAPILHFSSPDDHRVKVLESERRNFRHGMFSPRSALLQGTQRWTANRSIAMLPLWRELELSVPFHRLFPAFLDDPFPTFLESGLVHARLGRYSYMVSDPFLVIQSKNGLVRITGHGVDETSRNDPFEVLRHILSHYKIETAADLPPFQGGAVGYFGYDLAHHTERLPRTTVDDVAIPDLVVGLYDWTLAHDHGSGRTWIVSVPTGPGGQSRAEARMEEVVNRVLAIGSGLSGGGPHPQSEGGREGERAGMKEK